MRWNWMGGFNNSEAQQPFAVAMISAREVEEHYLNIHDPHRWEIYPSLPSPAEK